MKKISKKILIFILICVFLLPSKVMGLESILENTNNVILMEVTTKEILYEKNAHERHAMASMTKMMSLLLVMEAIDDDKLSLDDMVVASSYAASMGGSQIYLQAQEQMSVSDLIKGVAIASANDAIVALAEAVSGTEEKFVEAMNKKALELGLENTNFKNATGFDEANHYSSAYDMAIIGIELVKHQEILDYSSLYESYIREDTTNKFWLVNTNKLVRYYQGVDGLKTGYTSEAGYCLTATANKNSMRLVGVIMGSESSESRNDEMISLLDYGYNNFNLDTLLTTNTIVGEIEIDKASLDLVSIYPLRDYNILNEISSNNRDIIYSLVIDDNLVAPLKSGDIIGSIEIIENMNVIDKIPAIVVDDVLKTNVFNLFYRYFNKMISGSFN